MVVLLAHRVVLWGVVVHVGRGVDAVRGMDIFTAILNAHHHLWRRRRERGGKAGERKLGQRYYINLYCAALQG